MAQFFWYALTSSNINRFSKLFHSQNQEKMCNKTTKKLCHFLGHPVCQLRPCSSDEYGTDGAFRMRVDDMTEGQIRPTTCTV